MELRTIYPLTILFILLQNKSQSVPIVDIFCFNGEPMSLFRLYYLADVVDLFIVIEANVTHSGKRKPFYFVDVMESMLSPLLNTRKLFVYKLHFPSYINSPWEREKFQRYRGAQYALKKFNDTPFIAIIGDPDEIPRKDFIRNISMKYSDYEIGSRLSMAFFYFSFQWIISEYWASAFVINDIGLRKYLPIFNNIRVDKTQAIAKTIHNAGWHCSYFMNTNDIIRKTQSFAHIEYNTPFYTDRNWIEKCKSEGIDLYNRSNIYLLRYNGSYGYPICETCKILPDYKYFQIPN